MEIPVQNIYYLLCYAWDEFAPKQLEKIATEEFPDAMQLFARLLVTGVRSLHRRGFETGYVAKDQPASSLRGRILMGETLRLVAAQPSRVYCTYDEMSADVLNNQILKATLSQLLGTDGLDLHLRADVRQARSLFDQVVDIDLTPRIFYQVRVHQSNRLYAFLINVCRFLFDSLHALDKAGRYTFQDMFREPERLRRIYEKFVRNFYRINQNGFDVKKDRMEWQGSTLDGSDLTLLPRMETDVTLRSRRKPARTIVIECKYTESIYQTNYFKEKLRSGHLYQLAAYLHNLESHAEGILLYPTAGVDLDRNYVLQGHRIRIKTLDLNCRWPEIASSLLTLLEPYITAA